MRKYQLSLLTTSVNNKKVVAGIKEMLKGVKFEKEEELGEKDLAYEIKHQGKGTYSNFLFEVENLPEGFEKRLNSDENILRFLVIKQ